VEISNGAIIKCRHKSYVKVVNKSNLQTKTLSTVSHVTILYELYRFMKISICAVASTLLALLKYDVLFSRTSVHPVPSAQALGIFVVGQKIFKQLNCDTYSMIVNRFGLTTTYDIRTEQIRWVYVSCMRDFRQYSVIYKS
jgi:hypothetical protein